MLTGAAQSLINGIGQSAADTYFLLIKTIISLQLGGGESFHAWVRKSRC